MLLLLQRIEIAIVQPLLTGVPEHLRIDASSTNQVHAKWAVLLCVCAILPLAHQLSLLPQNQLL